MAYFKHLPKILYSFGDDRDIDLKALTDITVNTRIFKEALPQITLYEYYDLQDGETPEILAHKLYGDSEMHWIIMLLNERYDMHTDFPMSATEIDTYIENKYAVPDAIKHYVDADGHVVDSFSVSGTKPVSYRDYEYAINDAKRRVKIVSPTVAQRLAEEFRELVRR